MQNASAGGDQSLMAVAVDATSNVGPCNAQLHIHNWRPNMTTVGMPSALARSSPAM